MASFKIMKAPRVLLTCIEQDAKSNENRFDMLNRVYDLDIQEDGYWAFIYGFDGISNVISRDARHLYPELFDLGQRLRKKYIG